MSNFSQNEPMVEMYVYETMQLIDRLEQLVMESEQTASLDFAIDEIFRIMHTIKGNSMMMLYENIAVVAHRLEDLFDLLRTHTDLEYDLGRITDLALEMIDFVKNEVGKIESGAPPDGNSSELKEQITEYLEILKSGENAANVTKETSKVSEDNQKFYLSPKSPDASEVSDGTGENYYRIHIFYEMDSGMENIRAFTFIHTIKEQINEVIHIPKDVTNDPEACNFIILHGFLVFLKTNLAQDEMQKICDNISFLASYDLKTMTESQYNEAKRLYANNDLHHLLEDEEGEVLNKGDIVINDETDERPSQIILDDEEAEIVLEHKKEKIEAVKEAIAEAKPQVIKETKVTQPDLPKMTSDKAVKQAMISVDVNKVDKLMDLVGELVVSESMVTRNPEILELHLENFEKAARQFRIIMNELQDTVMGMRMVPLSLTFQKMNRIVRDMKKKTGKDVELIIIGENTEVDKNVIENIADPLMHIIRNSVDHGIETVEERIEAGKNEKGKIILEAKHSGGDVWIIVKDDGKGLDRDKILQKCEEKNLLTKAKTDYTDREVYEMLFEPGFSTKDEVTEFSGRGVGLDVVAKNIKKVGGTVLINSELGLGSEFAIKIPLTLAIINGMMMKVGKTIFSVPIVSIRESFIINKKDLTLDPDGNEMVMVRGQVYPILRLHERFGIETDAIDFNDGIMIMIEENGKEKVFFADAILGEQQLVVKSAPRYLRHVEGMTGFALLGDGRISIILDPDVLVS